MSQFSCITAFQNHRHGYCGKNGRRTACHKLSDQTSQSASWSGFTIIELLVVVSLVLLVAALSVPGLLQSVHTARLRGAGNDLSGLVQVARIRAVQDDRYYSVYPINNNGVQQQFVDIYPQNINGASGTGGTALISGDPSIVIPPEISVQPQASAPNISNLAQQLLPTNPNNLLPSDASVAATPITFGPEGLPCKPVSVNGAGTVCNSRGGAVAYWTFLQDSQTQAWQALTVTPSGRIQRWYFDSGNWKTY